MIISSSGIKNIIINSEEQDEFNFIFNNHIIRMNKIYAEFISPAVSQLHRTDPTANSIHIDNILTNLSNFKFKNYEDLFSADLVSLLQQISSGNAIKINEGQSIKLRLISIILGNEELYTKLNEIYPPNINESNIDHYLVNLEHLSYLHEISRDFGYNDIIDFISSQFYSLETSKLYKLPKPILYSIISNKNLVIKNEDSLLDFINEVFENDRSNHEIIQFYEQIEIKELSENKLHQFFTEFDINEMTHEIWEKLLHCLNINNKTSRNERKSARYSFESFLYEENKSNGFDGIIHHLTQEIGGNVAEKGVVNVIPSSCFGEGFLAKYAVDLDDRNHYFESVNKENSFIIYDFKERKVRPTDYTIRTRHDNGRGGYHLKNWVIEGLKSGEDLEKGKWEILDSRENITCLNNSNAIQTFHIQNEIERNQYFSSLRIRQTGPNIAGNHFLTLSALEFFGYVI